MRNALAIADRAAPMIFGLIAAANLLFFLSFLFVAVLAASSVRASAAECNGRDLLPGIASQDPAAMARIHEEALETPNGRGLLWRIEKNGAPASWLFGTMHMTDPRVVKLAPPAREAFDNARTVVIETTEILDPQAMTAAIMQHPELTMFTGGETLTSSLTPEKRSLIETALSERGIPPASVARMKPWMLIGVVGLPACELARKAAGAPILDVKLAEDARQAGKKIAGLETVVSQLRAMASLPMDFHIDGLVATLQLGDRLDDVLETMIVLYERGDIAMIWPLFDAALTDDEEDRKGFAAFEERMIIARNAAMARNVLPFLEEGGAFVAVGALHLPGEQGLIELLRNRGYRVVPAG